MVACPVFSIKKKYINDKKKKKDKCILFYSDRYILYSKRDSFIKASYNQPCKIRLEVHSPPKLVICNLTRFPVSLSHLQRSAGISAKHTFSKSWENINMPMSCLPSVLNTSRPADKHIYTGQISNSDTKPRCLHFSPRLVRLNYLNDYLYCFTCYNT